MNLRRRVRISLAIISVNSLLFLALYAWNLSKMSAGINEVRMASLQTRSMSLEMASCVSGLEVEIESFLKAGDARAARTVSAKGEECAALFTPQRLPMLPTERLDAHRALILDYTQTAIKIVANGRGRERRLREVGSELARQALTLRSPGAAATIAEALSAFALEIEARTRARSTFAEEATRLRIEGIRGLLSSEHTIPAAKSAAVGATLSSLEEAMAEWNKHVGLLGTRYQSERITVAKLPGEIPISYVEQIATRSTRAMDSLKVMGFWGGLSMVLLVGLLIAMLRWIGTKWNAALRRLNRLCGRIISGNGEVRTEIQRLCEQAAEQEDLGVAYEAIARTLDELNVLRQSLEDKVNERTKELRDAQQQIIQSGKLAALGTLAAGVAHELNNPLTIILGLAENLDDPSELPLEHRRRIGALVKPQVLRMARIIDQLKRLARKSGEQEHELVGLNALIKNSVVLLGSKLHHASVDFRVFIDPALNVHCDPVKMESIFTNLIQNAVDALEAVERPVRVVTVEASQQPNGSLLIRVIDNGPGVPSSIRHKIFEPFFTTKDVNRGTGLGLSLCYQIVEEMGGRMWMESVEGQGCAFLIELPAHRIQSTRAAAAA